jgi:aminoglycoside/choline kinase family phosphotransferase
MDFPDASDSRLALLTRWVMQDLGFEGARLERASADASFRRYFRVTREDESFIVMDAPPDKEALGPFLTVARMLADIGLNVPVVLASDLAQGLLLLTDLGSRPYLDELKAGRDVDRLYAEALDALVRLQVGGRAGAGTLPPYDRAALEREMALMPEWFLGRHLGVRLPGTLHEELERVFGVLCDAALSQPTVLVHRDYHSRNLLLTNEDNPGILDFQDAVAGALTYDVVSLLKDCYIVWPEARVAGWLAGYRESLARAGLPLAASEAQFRRWFDLMGLQRHLKVLGIFCRLYYRDGKIGYLADLPRVLDYTLAACARHAETESLARELERLKPRFEEAQARLLGARAQGV